MDDEFAWGNTTIESEPTSLFNSGESSEVPNQGNLNKDNATPDGPFRVGSFADAPSTRTNAGAGYYGALDLSGNLWERPVTLGNDTGRGFTGTHGDGVLSADGFATNSDWPGYDGDDVTGAEGSGSLSGVWIFSSSYARVADRNFAASGNTARGITFGYRCARSAP